jgi:hypothetical protein
MLHARKDYNRIQDPAGLIPADEPVFLLRGQDEVAARTVRYWAMALEARGGDPAIIEAARRQAQRMDDWPVKKMPDLPPPQEPAA